ncbi:MAG: hypothetical protein ACUVR0_10175 [Candidatus Aminicenantales bacterium]
MTLLRGGAVLFLSFPVLFIPAIYSRENPEQASWTITLNIYPTGISFFPGDPDLELSTPANSPVVVQISTWPPNRRWNLTIRAEGELVSAEGNVISISHISWTATPKPPFVDGVLVAGQSLPLASSRGEGEGELNFYFQNSWAHPSGEFTQVITLTASLI